MGCSSDENNGEHVFLAMKTESSSKLNRAVDQKSRALYIEICDQTQRANIAQRGEPSKPFYDALALKSNETETVPPRV